MTDVRSDIAALCTIAETAKVHGSPEAVDTARDVLPTLLTGIAAVLDAHQPVLRVFHPVAGHHQDYDRCEHCFGAAGTRPLTNSMWRSNRSNRTISTHSSAKTMPRTAGALLRPPLSSCARYAQRADKSCQNGWMPHGEQRWRDRVDPRQAQGNNAGASGG